MIGVSCNRENIEYEITANISTPQQIQFLAPGNGKIECHVFAGIYRYYAVKIDPRQRGKIVLNLGTGNDFDRLSITDLQNHGRGIDIFFSLFFYSFFNFFFNFFS
jgi:hypothetical protein